MLTEAIEAERGAEAGTAVALVVTATGTTTARTETFTAVAPAGLVLVPAPLMMTAIIARLLHVHVGKAERRTEPLGVIVDAVGLEAAARPPNLLKMSAIGAPFSCNNWRRDSEQKS